MTVDNNTAKETDRCYYQHSESKREGKREREGERERERERKKVSEKERDRERESDAFTNSIKAAVYALPPKHCRRDGMYEGVHPHTNHPTLPLGRSCRRTREGPPGWGCRNARQRVADVGIRERERERACVYASLSVFVCVYVPVCVCVCVCVVLRVRVRVPVPVCMCEGP